MPSKDRETVYKEEVRVFVPPFVIHKIDECIKKGDLGTNRSEVARMILMDWARGVLK